MPPLSIFIRSANSFEGKFPDEETVAVYRAHWFVLARQGVISLIALLPIIMLIFASAYLEIPILEKFIFFIASFYVLFWWYSICYIATMYYLNSWIVTDHRLIENTTLGFFRRNYTELHVSKIQDVSVDVNGMFETFLNFGDITVQSAGAENKFRMMNVPNPLAVKDAIMKSNALYLKVHKYKPHHIN